MSNWTHVAAVVRVETFGEIDFEKVFGRECPWEAPDSVWEAYDEHPSEFLPGGSEGTLHMQIEDHGRDYMCRYTVTISGDLRDHDSAAYIVRWFQKKLKQLVIRQAMITASNEINGTVSWVYPNQ